MGPDGGGGASTTVAATLTSGRPCVASRTLGRRRHVAWPGHAELVLSLPSPPEESPPQKSPPQKSPPQESRPPETPRPQSRWQKPSWQRLLRQIFCVLPLVAVAVWIAWNRSLLASGARQALAADRAWLLVAVVTTGLGFVAASFARQGSVVDRLPAGRLLATQVAAGSANHLLPSGIGASAVNIRFMARCGLPLSRSSTALALYFLAEGVARVVLLLVLLLAFPGALRLGPLFSDIPEGTGLLLTVGAVAAGCAGVVGVCLLRPVRRAIAAFLNAALTDVRALHARPSRALALWGGALAFPVLQAAGLVAIVIALELRVPVGHVVLAYLAATVAVAAVPTPGGIGSVEAALVIALVALGIPVTAATAAVLAYRVVTVWLPLLPGALLLAALVRWKIV